MEAIWRGLTHKPLGHLEECEGAVYMTGHTRSNGHMLLQNYIEAGDQDDNYTKLTDVIQVPDYYEKPVVHED